MPLLRRRGGFTLLELLVVMIIITITFFAVRPNLLHSLQFDRERAAVRQVMALLSSARTEAVARGRLVRIAISPEQAKLWAELQAEPDYTQPAGRVNNTADTDSRAQFDPVSLAGRRQVTLPESLEITGLLIGGVAAGRGEQAVYFFPDGRTSGAELTLAGASGQRYVIELSPVTGKVAVNV